MCCALTAATWHPASHAARQLLEYDAFATTWYVFWILPIIFIGLNLFIMPRNPGILEQGRLRLLYTVFGFVFLALLLLSYLLFYLMASSLNRNARLRSGNMLLLSVENSYDGEVRERNGVFLSSKRPGEGIGLQAVQHIAEKSGGYCRFHYVDGVFTTNVMLRGEK